MRFRGLIQQTTTVNTPRFQYLKGAIQRRADRTLILGLRLLSIPQRCDSESSVWTSEWVPRVFQYLKGAIQSSNPDGIRVTKADFQYLKGAIQRQRQSQAT